MAIEDYFSPPSRKPRREAAAAAEEEEEEEVLRRPVGAVSTIGGGSGRGSCSPSITCRHGICALSQRVIPSPTSGRKESGASTSEGGEDVVKKRRGAFAVAR